MNALKKKLQKSESPNWSKNSYSFIRKPAKGWIHPDYLIEKSCVTYETQYVGLIKVLESVKTIPFQQRGVLVREAILRCCAASNLYEGKKRKTSGVDAVVHKKLGDICLDNSGCVTSTAFSKSSIKTYILQNGKNIHDHNIQCISFASIGENEYKTFIGYISKDARWERACFVFDCKGDIADDVILTIGQAFELKYKEFLNSTPTIQPVLQRFTDPVPERSEPSAPAPFPHSLVTSLDRGPSQYAEIDSRQNDNKASSSIHIATPLAYHPMNNHNESTPKYVEIATISCGEHDYDDPMSTLEANTKSSLKANTRSSLEANAMPSLEVNGQSSLEVNGKSSLEANVIPSIEVNGEASLDETFEDKEDGRSSSNSISSETNVEKNDKTLKCDSRDIAAKLDLGPAAACKYHGWFHGAVSRSIAERCLKNDGDFLVRESTKTKGQYVLSGLRNGAYRHILLIDPEGKVSTKDHTFKDIPELINFHFSQKIPIYSGSSEVYLKREIHNTSI